MATSLETIDPAEAWKPAPKDQWNFKWAAHLFRRAAFGAPPLGFFPSRSSVESLEIAVERGMEECVDTLVDGGPGHEVYNELIDDDAPRFSADPKKHAAELLELRGWWLNRMVCSPHPLLERMTMFWHNHFATSVVKVKKLNLMLQQNKLLRQYALGNFRQMLLDIGHDPAMLIWLDSNSNVKGKPNENYAREVMELFSLGEGNYTENDIREAARAFTGWATDNRKFVFNKRHHDEGDKTVLGQTGKWDGDDVVRILLEQPAAARFLVRKLFRQFVSETESPPDRLIEPLADQLRKSDYNLKPCLQTMLRSRLFFSDAAYRQRIKSPVEYIVGLLNVFYALVPPESIAQAIDGLGQSLFEPPNVKGWDGGKTWLNSSTLLARHNMAWRLVSGEDNRFSRAINPVTMLYRFQKETPEQQVDFLVELLLQDEITEKARGKLIDFVEGAGQSRDEQNVRLRELMHTIMLMPQYQLI